MEQSGPGSGTSGERDPLRKVHLVGSMPLRSAGEVFELVSLVLGSLVRSIPDGETGERSMWIWTQIERLERVKGLRSAGVRTGLVDYPPGVETPYWSVEQGTDADAIRFGSLGYAEWAKNSYEVFHRLRQQGLVQPGTKFQVSLPTPFAVVYTWIDGPDRVSVLPAYERAMAREIEQICEAIPHQDLVFQWDVAMEFIVLENALRDPDHSMSYLIANILRIDQAIPMDVGVGLHLCYGDFGGIHNVDLNDTRLMTDFSNQIAQQSRRRFEWVHMPVIRTADHAFFAPLGQLRLPVETQVYLGLVHEADGVEGAGRRIEAARRSVRDFGVATECGMGRRAPQAIADLLALHREVASLG